MNTLIKTYKNNPLVNAGRPPEPISFGNYDHDVYEDRYYDPARAVYEWSKLAYSNMRERCNKNSRKFTIVAKDLENMAPTHCPILGIEINYSRGRGSAHANSPSVDRINTFGDYTIDNTWVISHQANVEKGRLPLAVYLAAVNARRVKMLAALVAEYV